MNLDLLTKLVKLANNNPNENEANLAARKVCKMIEEAKFIFNQTYGEPPPQQPIRNPTRRHGYRSPFDFSDNFEDIFKAAQEAAARHAQREEELNKKRKAEEERVKKEQPRYKYQPRDPFYTGYNPNQAQEDFSNRGPFGESNMKGDKREGLERECSRCHLKVKTFNKNSPFICTVCLINDWK